MRVLFTPLATRSHLQAQVHLAWALRAAGHQVCVAVAPDLAPDVGRTGLTGVAVGAPLGLDRYFAEVVTDGTSDPGESEQVDQEWAQDWDYLHTRISDLTVGWFRVVCPDPAIDDLVGFARRWQPDLVVWDPMVMAGGIAARACGAAHARLLFGSDRMGRLRQAFRRRAAQRSAGDRPDPLREWLEGCLERVGQPFDEDTVVGQWTIDPMPSWLRRAAGPHYVPMRYVPHNGTAMVPRWLREPPRRPRVCLTLGASHRAAHGGKVPVADLLDAVADLDIEVVATLDATELGVVASVPDNVRAVDFVPLGMLLDGCAAVVHPGGSGTFATALEQGVPQLVVPSTLLNEERNWGPVEVARGLAAQGAGIYVANSDGLDAGVLRADLLRVLGDESFARNAQRLRTEMLGMPSPVEVIPALERLTRQHRRRSAR